MARTVQSVLESRKKKAGRSKKRVRKPVQQFTINHNMPYHRYQKLRNKAKEKTKNDAYRAAKSKIKSTVRKSKKKVK